MSDQAQLTGPAMSTVAGAAPLEREISRLEIELFQGSLEHVAVEIDRLIPLIEVCGDNALLGRSLCILARVQIIRGQHEAATMSGEAGLRAFDGLETEAARRFAGSHSETFRAVATALLKLGRVAEALPKLETAVRIAQDGVDRTVAPEPNAAVISALSALIRALVTLGVALFAIREIDIAVQVYYRAIAVADAHPEAYERFPDDVMLAFWNLTDALHERATRRRAAGNDDLAAQDIDAARRILNPAHWKISEALGEGADVELHLEGLTPNSREGYFASMGRHLLITGRPDEARTMFERQRAEMSRKPFVDDWSVADAEAGMAQASLALGLPKDALVHGTLALRALDRHDESNTRATALLVHASAYRSLHEFGPAYDALVEHHGIRTRLEAVAAQQYAAHMTLQLGLERARADAESHRRIAATLETMGRVGQELTANLDADTVFAILQRHVVTLLHAPTFFVWLFDASGDSLSLAFGIEDGQRMSAPDIPLDHPRSSAARAVRERHEIFSETGVSGGGMLMPGTREMQAALFAPLIVAERVLGVVSIQSDRAAYTENERSIFRALSVYGAIALDNAAAYRKLAGTVEALQSTQAELALRTAEFERLSMTDPLTGVANRRHLHERGAVEIAEVKRKDGRLSVAMFDIDHFKGVNDTYGHAVGDAVLQNVARVAKEWLRPADFIARVGGEEFALLLPGAGIREAADVAERIRGGIAETSVSTGWAAVRVTSSFGVAEFDPAVDELDHVLSRADAALYAAKQGGRNRVHRAP